MRRKFDFIFYHKNSHRFRLYHAALAEGETAGEPITNAFARPIFEKALRRVAPVASSSTKRLLQEARGSKSRDIGWKQTPAPLNHLIARISEANGTRPPGRLQLLSRSS